jgi:Bacterial Ig-like domain (group 2)
MVRADLMLLVVLSLSSIAGPEAMWSEPLGGAISRGQTSVNRLKVTAPARTVKIGGTLRLSASDGPQEAVKQVKWTSSDTARATVNAAGVVTGVRTGKISITATSTANSRKTGSIEITVQCPAPRAVARSSKGDVTWQNWVKDPGCFDYVVTRDLVQGSGVLTIQPGTVVGFKNDVEMVVTRNGALSAVGDAGQPILLTGTEKVRGYWRGLRFTDSGSAMNRLDHVTIEYGGSRRVSFNQAANLAVTHGSSTGRSRVSVSHTMLRESNGYGLFVRAEDELAGFTGNTLTKNALGPAYVAPPVVGALQAGNKFTGNDADFVSVPAGGGINNIRRNATWHNIGVPYQILAGAPNELTVEERAVLRIEPGVDVRFGAGVGMSILKGSFLVVEGAPNNPVSLHGDNTQWRGIRVHDSSAYFEHVAIGDAGSARWSGAREPGAVTIMASNGGLSKATFGAGVSTGGAHYGAVFTHSGTFGLGCPAQVFVPPPDSVGDHCNAKGVVRPPAATGQGR